MSTLDQDFRRDLRVSLTKWASYQPIEFAKLVSLLFKVADPQIQEDLASIALALAGKIKSGKILREIAKVALEVVFDSPVENRNVIVRAGFQAVVERALQFKEITEEEAAIARPHRQNEIRLIGLDKEAVENPAEEIYPIVRDLALYVIKGAYSGFLSHDTFNEDFKSLQALLNFYQKHFQHSRINNHSWAMAAAIGYMRSLGFDRKQGNVEIDESHGAKSKLFTYEEKYTWLAVHYLKGYLADYVPYSSGQFIDNYYKIIHVPNPGENLDILINQDHRENFDRGIISTPLLAEYHRGEVTDYIHNEVLEDSQVDFSKLLFFRESQFYLSDSDNALVALYNNTKVLDRYEFVYAQFDAISCLIPTGQTGLLQKVLKDDAQQLNFITHLDQLITTPGTDTYANASDIIWMNWLGDIAAPRNTSLVKLNYVSIVGL